MVTGLITDQCQIVAHCQMFAELYLQAATAHVRMEYYHTIQWQRLVTFICKFVVAIATVVVIKYGNMM